MNIRQTITALLVLLVAAVVMVPFASAGDSAPDLAAQSVAAANESMIRDGITLKTAGSAVIQEDIAKYNKQLTKDEFLKANQKNIEVLAEKFGKDAALKMADAEYQKSSGKAVSPLTVSSYIVQIWGYDVFLWPYQARNPSTSDPDVSPVNFIVLKKNALELMAYMQSHGWHVGYGWNDYGLHGRSRSALSWTSCDLYPFWTQMEIGSYFGDRYHAVITNADYSYSISDDWTYGNAHHEYWNGYTHIIYGNGFNQGRSQMYSTLSGGFSSYWVALYNSMSGYADGWGLIFQ